MMRCPECGGRMVAQSGCYVCPACGYCPCGVRAGRRRAAAGGTVFRIIRFARREGEWAVDG